MRKKVIYFALATMMMFALTACGSKGLNGSYSSEGDKYTVEFNKDGTCTWYESGMFFPGEYEKTEDGYRLNISGGGLYGNTSFEATVDGDSLIINGGMVYDETFTKK